MKLVWHYTTRHCANGILRDNQIHEATQNVPDGEIPVTWFSAHPIFEPTATKPLKSENRLATWEEMVNEELWRFGVSPLKLLCWHDLISVARISPYTVQELVQVAGERNANPLDWFGITRPVLLTEIAAVERFDGNKWV